MDEQLEKLIKELGEAINDAVHQSGEVKDAIERLRLAGHEVMLVLEATIAFKDKASNLENLDDEDTTSREISVEERLAEISHEDRQFLRSLNIRFDNNEE